MKIASPTFYSLRDSRTPVLVGVTSVAINLGPQRHPVSCMGFRGLALGTAIAAGFNAVTLLLLLRRRARRHRRQAPRRCARSRSRSLAAIMGVVALQCVHALGRWLPGDAELTRGGPRRRGHRHGDVALVAAARLLRIEEFTEATNRVLRRIVPGRR